MQRFLRFSFISLISCMFLCIGDTLSQITPATNWTWLHGDNRTTMFPVHGTQFISSAANTPGGRQGAASWKDASGNMWVYGGIGFGFDCNGWLSDLWKYDVNTNEWSWMHGSKQERTVPVFGTLGVPSAANTPGSRIFAATWTDPGGNLWLFGGHVWGTGSGTWDLINDLWKFDINTKMWTWVKGDNTTMQPGVYGVQGVPANANKPGAREAATTWTDATGNLWMYGGAVLSINGGQGGYSDLWKYDPSTNQWTWMKGDNTPNQPGNYGVQGVTAATNNPGARNRAMSCVDTAGKFWLMGGRRFNDDSPTYMNDLWKYDPLTNNWTWVKGSSGINPDPVYGVIGVPAINNTPGGRMTAVFWADTSGNLLVWGGRGRSFTHGNLNDLWKYNIITNQWAWIKGAQVADQPGVYGSLGVPAAANDPGARHKMVSIRDASGDVYLMGGEVGYYNVYNDVWKYKVATNEWVWIKGDDKINRPPVYGTQAVPDPANSPGEKSYMTPWSDPDGNLWAFGGGGIGGYYNTVWKYDPATNQWTWIKGNNSPNKYGVYGTKGIPAPANTPGSRGLVSSWSDAAGNLWIFGGDAYLTSPNTGFTNELWKYDITTNQWVWLNGVNQPDVYGTYGTMGVPGAANTPGARTGASTWMDSNGDLWLFGGWGYASSNFPNGLGLCNDLWKYTVSTNQWTWISGSNTINAWPVYGVKGIESPNNRIGSRAGGAGWIDASGNLWLFGGYGYTNTGTGNLNEIWRYNISNGYWTWMKGDNIPYPPAVYGTQGVPAAANNPGGHGMATRFIDEDGNFWFWGGSGNLSQKYKDDLWKYDVQTGLWTWVKGGTAHNQYGVYGTKGVTSASDKPGTRDGTVGWYVNGNLWIYSGTGSSSDHYGPMETTYGQIPYSYGLNDLWILGTVPPRPDTIRFCANGSTNINANISGASYQWQQNTGSGFVNISNNANFSGTNTATLGLTNIPLSWNGYRYRCLVNSNFSITTIIYLNSLPNTNAGPDASICSGGSTQLNGSGGITYSWTPATGLSNPNIANPVASPTITTAYILTAYSNTGCFAKDTVLVTVNSAATPSVNINTPNTTVCSGSLVTFTATPVNEGPTPTYQWQVNGINAGTNSNIFNTVSLNNNDQVKVILTSSLACATPAIVTSNIITMTVTPLPFANAGNDTTICAGTSAQLQGSGGSTYSWSPAGGLSNPNIANPIATPLATTRYYLTVSNGPACSAVDSVLVTVNLSASASVNINATNTTICSGTSVTFNATANGAGSSPVYQWQVNGINAGTNSNTFTITTLNNNDQVKVIMTSSLPCVSPQTATSNTITMSVSPAPVANAGSDISICAGASAQLQGSGGSIYSWSPATGLSNPLIANPVASPLITTAYILTVSNGGTCTSKDTVVITVNQLLTPTVNISASNTNICSGTAVTFTAAITNGGAAPVYQWQLNGINAGTNSNTFTSSSLQNNDQVKLILTSNLACVLNSTATSNTITMSVQQLATPLITLSNSVFTVTNPDAAATYTWQVFLNSNWINVVPAATGISFTSPGAGEYRVRAVKGGCTAYSASVVAGIVNPTSPIVYLRPNPAHNFIRLDSIRLQKRYETVEITDMQGKRVLPLFNVKNQVTITIDISCLASGPYMAIIRQYDGTFSAKKFIKQ